MNQTIHVDGQPFDTTIEHFSFPLYHNIQSMEELGKLSLFPSLRSASFCGTTLDDIGLEYISRVATLENLDLQNTKITNDGLAHLARLPRLRCLRLKENSQLTNQCVPHLRRVESLMDLGIHETSIDQHGLQLLEGMGNLRDICVDVWNDNYTFDGLLALSARMPDCTILAKGHGEFAGGHFHGTWMMTEQEWLASDEPHKMLNFLRSKTSDRKQRLFAVACCLRVWSSLKHDAFRKALESAEKFADGRVSQDTMTEARQAALAVFVELHGNDNGPAAALSAAGIPAQPDSSTGEWWEDEFDRGDPLAPALLTSTHAARAAADEQGQSLATARPAMYAEYRTQAAVARCIFGNPFSTVAVDSAWLTSTVIALAQAIYEHRAFDRLPILADALEEVSCTSADVLSHCRGPGPHARGCWVVDLLLGKE